MSGTRLQAQYWLADDGTRAFDTWYDTKLATPCQFEAPSDDSSQSEPHLCKPITAFTVQPIYFAGADCQTQTGIFEADFYVGTGLPYPVREARCGATKYGKGSDGTYELGPSLAGTNLYKVSSNGCVPLSASDVAAMYAIGRKVDPAEFVPAHIEKIDTGHHLSGLTLVADDGTRQPAGWFDTLLDTECSLATTADGKVRCAPSAVALEDGTFDFGYFSDEACTMQVGLIYAGTESIKGFVRTGEPSTGGAPTGSHFFKVGDPVTGNLYRKDGGSCMLFGPADPDHYYSLVEIPSTDMDLFNETTTKRDRLNLAVFTDQEGAIDSSAVTITDALTNELCEFTPTADGQARCLPRWRSVDFVSMTCSGAMVVNRSAPPSAPTISHAGLLSGEVCMGVRSIFEYGAPIPAPEPAPGEMGLFLSTVTEGGACAQDVFVPVPSTDAPFNAVGAEVPLSSFAAGKIVTE